MRERPGAFSAASSSADFTCAEATATSCSMASGCAAPRSVTGISPPSRASYSAPNRVSGSSTRRIGRRRRDASPVSTARIAVVATAPITSRAPVPLLPKSRTQSGSARPPTPLPQTRHIPSPSRSRSAPSADIALAVPSTSSASSRPETLVSPTASAPRIRALWEMDLSPGTGAVPASGPARRAVSGLGVWEASINVFDRPGQKWQTTPLSETGLHAGSITLVKAELGIKRVCPQCAARFYDLTKRPIECPKCHFSFEPESLYKQRRARQPEPVAVAPVLNEAEDDEETEETEEAEAEEEIVEAVPDEAPVVMSEDDDEVVEEEPEPEAAGMSVVDADDEDAVADIEVEDDEEEADDALLAEVEDDEDDVTDIIDADIEKDER